MSPPLARPFPRFIADTPQDTRPYGEWSERLTTQFAEACAELHEQAGAALDPESLRFYPERTWGGRTFVPAVGRAAEDQGGLPEYYGYVSFARPGEGDPTEFEVEADFTDVTAEENPGWRMDLNDSVIGEWRGEGGRGGEVTLIWGTPLVRGAIAASAELDGEVIDQAAVNDGRFSLIAVDAVHGFDDELFLEIHLWDRRLKEVARESLYEPDAEGENEPGEGVEAAQAEDAEPLEDPGR